MPVDFQLDRKLNSFLALVFFFNLLLIYLSRDI